MAKTRMLKVNSVVRTHTNDESCVDRNAYEREAVTNKNSDQMITSDKKSYMRENPSQLRNHTKERKRKAGLKMRS